MKTEPKITLYRVYYHFVTVHGFCRSDGGGVGVGSHGLAEELKDGAPLLPAGHDRGSSALAPPLACLAARPLRDPPVNHAMPEPPFRYVVGRLDRQGPKMLRFC